MARRKRRQTIPCLESMEDRMVPSAISFSPSVTAQIHKMGNKVHAAAHSVQSYLASLIQHRPGHGPIPSWTTHHVWTHQTNKGLFGIPWLKF